MSLFEVEGLSVRYGGVRALDGVDLQIESGSLVGLIGPNGAGKTTFIDAISGFTPAAQGSVHLDGRDITRLPAHRRARLGLARTFQSSELFSDLTLRENLLVAADKGESWAPLADMVHPGRQSMPEEFIDEQLQRFGLLEHADRRPEELSFGSQKLVALARTMAQQPVLALLDEPAAGLHTQESELLGQRLRALVDGGSTLLLVDHDMGLVLSVCDRIYVLDFGRIIAQGTPQEIRQDHGVIEAYLGTDAEDVEAAAASEKQL